MKRPICFLPPAAALLVSGLWLGLQHRSISHTETYNQGLEASIHQARGGGAGAAGDASGSEPGAREGRPARSSQPGGSRASKIRWDEIARSSRESERGHITSVRQMLELQSELHAMSEGELVAQLREIEALELPENEQLQLQAMVIEALSQKNPALALEQCESFLDSPQQGMIWWNMRSVLSALARQDPAAAEAWLDRQIAAGRLESRALHHSNQAHLHMETGLLRELLTKDPAALERRVRAMDGRLRLEVLEQLASSLPPGQEKSYATQVRASLSEEDAARVLAGAAQSHFHRGSFDAVENYLNASEATAAERETAVGRVATSSLQMGDGDIGESYEAARAWARSMLPEESMDAVTRNMLQQLLHRDAERALTYAREHHAEGGSDDVLLPFIGHPQAVASGAAREMAESLRDPELRQQMLDALDGGE